MSNENYYAFKNEIFQNDINILKLLNYHYIQYSFFKVNDDCYINSYSYDNIHKIEIYSNPRNKFILIKINGKINKIEIIFDDNNKKIYLKSYTKLDKVKYDNININSCYNYISKSKVNKIVFQSINDYIKFDKHRNLYKVLINFLYILLIYLILLLKFSLYIYIIIFIFIQLLSKYIDWR